MPETDTTNMINALNTAAPTGKPLAEIYQNAESASTGRGRPSTVSSLPEPLPDLPGAAATVENTRQMATTMRDAVTIQQVQLAEMVGQLRAFDFMTRFSGLAQLKFLAELKETKAYKGQKALNAKGELVEMSSFGDVCEVLGISRSKADEDIQNLAMFGEDFLEASQRLGLGYRQLRQLRALPEDTRQLVIEGEAVRSNDPEALKDLLEDLAARNAAIRKEKEDLAADLAARDKVLEDKGRKLDEAQTELTKIKTLPPDKRILLEAEREADARKKLDAAMLDLVGSAVQAFAVSNGVLMNPDGTSVATARYVHEVWSHTCVRLNEMLHENGIDVDFRQIVYPDWMGAADGKRGDRAAEITVD
jgi:hypothetical protein